MRRFAIFLVLLLFAAVPPSCDAQDWQMIYPRVNHGALVVGNHLVVLGGDNGESHGSQIFYSNGEVLNKETGENMGEFPISEPANFPLLTEIGGQIYFFISDGMGVTVKRLLPDLSGEDTGFSAPAAWHIHSRGAICPDLASGRVYFISGSEAVAGHNQCEYFDTSIGTWVQISDLPITEGYPGRQAGFAQMDGGILKVAGGYTCNSSGSDFVVHKDEFWYDPASDTWTISTPMQEARMALGGAGGYWTSGQDVVYPTPTGTPGRPPEPPQIIYQDTSEKDALLLNDTITGRVGHVSYLSGDLLVTGGGGGPPDPLPVEVQDTTGRRGARDVPVEPAIGAVLALDPVTGHFYWIGGLRENGSRELVASTAVDKFSLATLETPATGPIGLAAIILLISGIIIRKRSR